MTRSGWTKMHAPARAGLWSSYRYGQDVGESQQRRCELRLLRTLCGKSLCRGVRDVSHFRASKPDVDNSSDGTAASGSNLTFGTRV
jgi:hypothetical protein